MGRNRKQVIEARTWSKTSGTAIHSGKNCVSLTLVAEGMPETNVSAAGHDAQLRRTHMQSFAPSFNGQIDFSNLKRKIREV
jgi:hypothetical protein